MTTNQAPGDFRQGTTPLPELWDDERISVYSWNAPTAFEARRLYDAMRRVRDDYEHALYDLRNDVAIREKHVARLEAKLENARKWLPDSALEDKE
jgi:hypothetical protein